MTAVLETTQASDEAVLAEDNRRLALEGDLGTLDVKDQDTEQTGCHEGAGALVDGEAGAAGTTCPLPFSHNSCRPCYRNQDRGHNEMPSLAAAAMTGDDDIANIDNVKIKTSYSSRNSTLVSSQKMSGTPRTQQVGHEDSDESFREDSLVDDERGFGDTSHKNEMDFDLLKEGIVYCLFTLLFMATLFDSVRYHRAVSRAHCVILTFGICPVHSKFIEDSYTERTFQVSIATIEVVCSALILSHHAMTLRDNFKRELWLERYLLLPAVLQLGYFAAAAAGYAYQREGSQTGVILEWIRFALCLAWGMTYPRATLNTIVSRNNTDSIRITMAEHDRKGVGMSATIRQAYCDMSHYPVLLGIANVFGLASIALQTYLGAVISNLTSAAVQGNLPSGLFERLFGHQDDKELVIFLGVALIIVWLSACATKAISTYTFAKLLSRVDTFLRRSVVARSAHNVRHGESNEDAAGAYASIPTAVRLIQSIAETATLALLQIFASFAFLWIIDLKAGAVALSFLVVICTAATAARLPMAIADRKAREVPSKIKEGTCLLGDITSLSCDGNMDTSMSKDELARELDLICDRHDEIAVRLQRMIFSRTYLSRSVQVYLNVFGSYISICLVINLTFSVYNGQLPSTEYLTVFYTFGRLTNAAQQLTGTMRTIVTLAFHLERTHQFIREKVKI